MEEHMHTGIYFSIRNLMHRIAHTQRTALQCIKVNSNAVRGLTSHTYKAPRQTVMESTNETTQANTGHSLDSRHCRPI